MDTQIVLIFCLCADLLKGLHHVEDRQSQLSDAEVMTAAIVAMLYFRGNFRMACQFLCEYDYMPHMLSRSRFNCRLHRISELFLTLFLSLGEYWKVLNERSSYVLDSYPIIACDNYRSTNQIWLAFRSSDETNRDSARASCMMTKSFSSLIKSSCRPR
jgi:hypothetical protein